MGFGGGANLYAYAAHNPTNLIDPSGEILPCLAASYIRCMAACMLMSAAEDYFLECGNVDWGDNAKECAIDCLWSMLPMPNPCGKFGKWFGMGMGIAGAAGMNSFTADTLVQVMPAGAGDADATQGKAELKSIGALQVGDKVLALAEWKERGAQTGADARLAYERVTDIYTSRKEQVLVHLALAGGEQLTATEGHPFKTSEGWRDAVLLKRGGKLLLKGSDESESPRTATIAEVTVEKKTVQVFNLEVANAHTFFVGVEGALVHNGAPPPNLSPPGAGRRGAVRAAKRGSATFRCASSRVASARTLTSAAIGNLAEPTTSATARFEKTREATTLALATIKIAARTLMTLPGTTMTTDAQVRCRYVQDVCVSNEVFLLDAPKDVTLAGVELAYADRWNRDRSSLWDLYQSSLVSLLPTWAHYLLHAERVDELSAARKLALRKRFWGSVHPRAEEHIEAVPINNQEFLFGWAKIDPSVTLASLDSILSTDKYFLVSMSASTQGALRGLCASGWDDRLPRSMQIPHELSLFLTLNAALCAVPLGRFDDPDFSVICIGQAEVLAQLRQALPPTDWSPHSA